MPFTLMAAPAEEAGVLSQEAFSRHYDERNEKAVALWLCETPADLHKEVREAIGDAANEVTRWWEAAATGSREPAWNVGVDEDEEQEPRAGLALVAEVVAKDG